jgi:hypothetical protein
MTKEDLDAVDWKALSKAVRESKPPTSWNDRLVIAAIFAVFALVFADLVPPPPPVTVPVIGLDLGVQLPPGDPGDCDQYSSCGP